MCVSLMATNLVKWWKTKFLNGYKQFSVLPSVDGRPSDTEELLSRGPDPPPEPPSPPSPPPDEDDALFSKERRGAPPGRRRRLLQLAAEGLESEGQHGACCDKGRRRQEFSFTLYDFDGHGKVTKDDITGLVTTIYESIGPTIRVPHCGSKTIKVKLTVSPEKRPQPAADSRAGDVNVTIRERRGEGEVVIVEAEVEPCCGRRQKRREPRSGSLQRQELLQIIRANMEKNSAASSSLRKQCSPPEAPQQRHDGGSSNDTPAARRRSHRRLSPLLDCPHPRGRSCPAPAPPPPRPSPRSRSHDLPYRTLEEEAPRRRRRRCRRGRAEEEECEASPPAPQHGKQHRRRREEEQARAMAQVVRWLERGRHFLPPGGRREYRHVHEHIHHHYHHHQQQEVIV